MVRLCYTVHVTTFHPRKGRVFAAKLLKMTVFVTCNKSCFRLEMYSSAPINVSDPPRYAVGRES